MIGHQLLERREQLHLARSSSAPPCPAAPGRPPRTRVVTVVVTVVVVDRSPDAARMIATTGSSRGRDLFPSGVLAAALAAAFDASPRADRRVDPHRLGNGRVTVPDERRERRERGATRDSLGVFARRDGHRNGRRNGSPCRRPRPRGSARRTA